MSLKQMQVLTINGEQYQITEQLDEGMRGLVSKGINVNTKDIVVIKETQLSGCSPQELRQIERETQLFQTLKHPNIVKQFGVAIQNNVQFTVMEPLSKLSDLQLSEMPQQQRNEVCELIAIDLLLAIEYLSTVGAAHEGVVHRDIMEDNVMIKGDKNNFTTKIIGFNMARMVSGSRYTINAGNQFHRAPECWGNEPQYSTASDLWAVGILLYMLVTQLLPYQDKTSKKSVSVSQIRSFQPSKQEFVNGIVEKLPNDISQTLRNLIMGLLSNDKTSGRQNRIKAMNCFLSNEDLKQKIKSRSANEQFLRLFPKDIEYIEKIGRYGIEQVKNMPTMQMIYIGRDLKCPTKQVEIQKVSVLSLQLQLQEIKDGLSNVQKFNHLNIVKLYDYFFVEQDLYQVFELFTPVSMLDIHKQKPEIKTMMLTKIAIDLILAIQFLHSQGITHGEITKENVQVKYDGTQNFVTSLSCPNITLGMMQPVYASVRQLYYMPPEFWPQLQNPIFQFTTEIDLWQVGILIYELCSGTKPYPDNQACFLQGKIHPLPADVHPSLKKLIYGLLNVTNPQALVQVNNEYVIDRAANVSLPQLRITAMNSFLSSDMNLRFVQQRCSKQIFEQLLLLKKQQGKQEEFEEFGQIVKGNNSNQYKIIKTLHTISALVIYLAQDEKNLCAIKKKDLCGLEEPELSQAKNESIILQSITKQTMLQVLDVINTEDEQYIVTEFLQPLSELNLQQLPETERNNAIRRISFDLLMNAKYLNEMKIIHRDIRPANIMVSINFGGEFIAKLIDFGSVIIKDQKDVKEVGQKKYRAPECWGASPQYSYYSDLFAIGVVLLELCNPQLNLRIENKQQIENILNTLQIPQFVSQDIKNLIIQLLSPEPKTRQKLVFQFTMSQENKNLFLERSNQNGSQ